jgi:PAS domain S-box-containing protein
MNPSVLSTWYAFVDLVPRRTAQESAALIVLAASLLVFRTFRQRYLLVWIVGWLAYFLSLGTLNQAAYGPASLYLTALAHAEFILAVCLFAAAALVYTHARKFLPGLLVISTVVMGYAVAQALLWPDSDTHRLALELGYRLVALAVAIQLIRACWGRTGLSSWLLTLSLLLLHLEWAPLEPFYPPSTAVLADLFLGCSMLLLVFDDSRMHTRRLAAINALTNSIARAQQHGPMMATALEELNGLMRAKAAWFGLLEDDSMVLAQQIGLSPDFLRDLSSLPVDETLAEILRGGEPVVLKTAAAPDHVRPFLRRERFRHVVLVPVLGKKSPIGTLFLGSRRISYAPDELEFLANTAQQLGLAVENLRLVEQVLRSHRQWSNTFDSIHDCVLVHDVEFRVVKANRSLLQRLNQSAADLAERPCSEVLPHDAEWKNCPYCVGEEEGVREGPDLCFGDYAIVSTSSYTEQDSKLKRTIHVIRDVTDRRDAEEKYRLLFEQVQEGVFVANPDGKLLDCNNAFVRMLGYGNREEAMAKNIEEEIYASTDQADALRRELELHHYVRNFEVTLKRKDGVLLTAVQSSIATRDPQGKMERYQGFLLDVTEKKQAEDEIRRRNRELNALNAMAVIATQSFDLDEILNLTLRQVISLLGAETGSIYLSDADEKTYRRRAGWGQRSADRARFSEVQFNEGFGDLVTRSRTEVITPEYLPHLPPLVAEFIRADGLSSWIWVLLWSKDRPIGIIGISSREVREYTSNDENLLVAIGRQLATTIEKVRLYEETCRAYEDLRHAQEQLLQSEKMSAIGQLIAGVAHELNNPLTAILGYAQLLESEGLGERAADFVSKLFKQAQRTHRVVQSLLSFARQRKPQKQQVDICRVLEETLVLRDYDLKVNNIRLVRGIDSSVPAVTGDPHQLEQVFLNIINNAVDAILEAGPGGTLQLCVHPKDGKVNIEFHDTGKGIKEPHRIFDPFYTTKSIGKGTGLGLSICYGIVKEHGGEISARNREEGGATIAVTLPAAAASAAAIKTPGATPRRDLAVQGRILLVEDEAAVLEFERDVLVGAGAQVTALLNCEETQARLRQDTFDAIIMGGKISGGWSAPEAYRWLAEKHPDLLKHALFTFASLAEPEVRDFLHENNVAYLVKPFEVSELIAQARRLVQKTQAASVY